MQRLIPYQHLIRTFSFERIIAENKITKSWQSEKAKQLKHHIRQYKVQTQQRFRPLLTLFSSVCFA
jgi:hypothetical protein